MSDLLSIGATGVRAYQSALSTTSENIANAGSAGFVRRSAVLGEVVAASGSKAGSASGLGVRMSGIVRAGDPLRSGEVRQASADLARTETGAAWLERIESALTGNKLGDRLTAFFTSAKQVAADPSAPGPRGAMLEAASSLAAAFSATGGAIDAAMADLDSTAGAATAQLNNLATGLAKINSGISRSGAGSAGMAALLDQRDQLLEQMSAITDVAVTFDAVGRATVRAGGAAGPVLVQGAIAGEVSYARNDEGAVAFAVKREGSVQALLPNGGALAGVADGAQRIAAARDALDQMAADFANGVNAVQANGRDLDGNSGAPMFAIGDPPSQLTLTLADPRGIAAASVAGGSRDNSNLAGFETLRETGQFESGMSELVASNAAAISGRRTVAEAQSSIRDAAISARDSITGVNIDEEAVDLIRFQQAFQASSRVIQVARETLQSILEIR